MRHSMLQSSGDFHRFIPAVLYAIPYGCQTHTFPHAWSYRGGWYSSLL